MSHDNSRGDVYVDGFADDAETEPPRNPFRQRGFMLATVLVALVVVLGVVVTALSLTDKDDPPSPSGQPDVDATASASPTANGDPSASRCGLPGYETSGALDEPPSDVTWQLVGTVAVPASTSAGPGETGDDAALRYCYSHTPEGAVLMAANTTTWGQVDDGRAILEVSVAAGPGHEVALTEWGSGSSGSGDDAEYRGQIAGFDLAAYTGEAAVVDLALELESGQLVSAKIELAWEQNDWRLRLTPDGRAFQTELLPNLSGYVPWRGV
jgi:hypothetical protein